MFSRNVLTCFLVVFGTIFILHYEGYHDIGMTEIDRLMSEPVLPERIPCLDIQCVEKVLEEKGGKHLISIIKIEYPEVKYVDMSGCEITYMKLTKKLTVDYE